MLLVENKFYLTLLINNLINFDYFAKVWEPRYHGFIKCKHLQRNRTYSGQSKLNREDEDVNFEL